MTHNFRSCWKVLALTDVVFKISAFVLFTPLVALLLRLFISVSGREVLADLDIAYFFLHPLGWLCGIIVGSLTLSILALEQTALLLIAAAFREGRKVSCRQAIWFALRHARAILYLTFRIAGTILLILMAGLIIAAVLFRALLAQHDINYYLAEKPAQFWLAIALIAPVLIVMTAILLRLSVPWILALPIYLFESAPAASVLRLSSDRAIGHRKRFVFWFAGWLIANSLVSTIVTSLVFWMGRRSIPLASNAPWLLTIIVGTVLLLWGATQVVITLVGTTTLTVLLIGLYSSTARGERLRIPEFDDRGASLLLRLTWIRGVLLMACSGLIAVIIGLFVVQNIHLVDDVQITAHRGASVKAPENTMAAIRQAIAEKADWIEVDVQESADNVVLVAHDRDLKRVSGSDLTIWKSTAKDLRSVDIGSYYDPKFKDERVPTLQEVLELCKGKAKVYIELKYYGHDRDLERRVVELVEEHDMQSEVRIISLEMNGLKKVKRIRPTWTIGLLTAVAAGDLTRADVDLLAVKHSLAKRSFLHAAHRRNKDVLVWTVNDRQTMNNMIARGVDGIITDDPGLARAVLDEHAQMNVVEQLLLKLADLLGRSPGRPAANDE